MEKIIVYLKEYGKIKRETVDKLFNVSSARSKVILSELLKEKIIEKVGTGKSTYYILNTTFDWYSIYQIVMCESCKYLRYSHH